MSELRGGGPLIKGAGMATIACAALMLSACNSSNDDATSAAEPTEVATSEEPADDLRKYLPTIEPGTYTYTRGPFPVTYTTTEATYDPSKGGDPYRVLLGDPYGSLSFDFPVNVADLSQLVTAGEPANEQGELFAGPIDFPADIGAWLEGAVALEIVDQGTLSLADGDASWWDVEVSDPSARCFSDSPPDEDDPCVVLWPYLDEQDDRQIGEWVLGPRRVYAIEAGSEPLMVVAGTDGTPEVVAGWLATTDAIVASFTLE